MQKAFLLGVLAALGVLGAWMWFRGAMPPPANQPAAGPIDPREARAARPLAVGSPRLPGLGGTPLLAASAADLGPQERYDAALLEALDRLAERKYPEALAALESARAAQDTDQVRRKIDQVKCRIEQEAEAGRTVRDIAAVLGDGRADEAARLAADGLRQYGGTDWAPRLAGLKRQADALAAAAQERAAGADRLRVELDVSLRDKNLRGAALVLERLLQAGEDPGLRRQFDEVRTTLARYDDCRRRAAELRRDPANLEEALAALREAARAWDTLEVRQEIDDYTLALQKRRDRLAVADFEVRGDVGLPAAGRTLAEELLPAFKCRFDLVERAQLGKVIAELRLEAGDLADNDRGRQEVGRLARLRYLVLGSVTPLGNRIAVNGRLVDVRTGLIVQTARLTATTADELLGLLPRLARVLMMTDEQKFAYEQELARQPAVEVAAAVVTVLPPPPPAPDQAPPPPVIACTTRPPDFGNLHPEDFAALPPPDQPPPPPVVVVEEEVRVKNRLLQVSLQLGDNLFRRGRYQEARRHFEIALNLSPGRKEVRLRVERCREQAPPPPPVVVVAPPPPPRPRVAVFSFLVSARPDLAPPGLGDWAAEQVACHLAPAYEVIDRGELFWYMGRLGLSVRDVLANPAARVWLARALGVRFFVFGVVLQTHSFDVSTHLVDAESGARQGTGHIHVQDHQELKLRFHELAEQALQSPAEQKRLEQKARENEPLVREARRLLQGGKPDQAAAACRRGLKRDPGNVALRALQQQADQQARQQRLEQERQQALKRQQTMLALAQKREQELVRQAEAARARAEREARAQSEAARRAREQQRLRAHDQLLAQGQQALAKKDYPRAVQAFEGALALNPSEAARAGLAKARARAADEARARADQAKARREAELRRQKEAELARTRKRLADERRRLEAEEQARRKAQEARDRAAYAAFLADGKRLLGEGRLEAAAAALQAARRLRATAEVDQLARQVADKLSREHEVEQRVARARQLVASGKAKVAARQFEAGILDLNEALRTNPADRVALAALREAEARRAAAAEAARQAEARRRADRFQTWVKEGRAALDRKQYEQAVRDFSEALKCSPTDPTASALLRQAEKARSEAAAQTAAGKQREEERRRAAEVQNLLAQARAAQAARDLDGADRALSAAARLAPWDPAVRQARQDLHKARQAGQEEARRRLDEARRTEDFNRLMAQGQAALAARRYEEAVQAFTRASQLRPDQAGAAQALREARRALDASRAPRPNPPLPAIAPGPKPAPQPGMGPTPARLPPAGATAAQTQFQAFLKAGATFEQLQKFPEAVQAYQSALKLQPNDPAAAGSLKRAQFAFFMAEGQKALAARRFPAAAQQFEAALKLFPGHPAAANALKQARQGR